MTQRQGRAFLGNVAGRSAAGGLVPRDVTNVIQSLGPSYNVGPFQGVNPADLIVLIGGLNLSGVAANRYGTLHRTVEATGLHSAGTDYQVPAGQQLIIGVVTFSAGAASAEVVIGYGDTGVATDTLVAPTNAVALVTRQMYVAEVADRIGTFTDALIVPASKFVYMFSVDAVAIGLKLICQLRNA